MAFAVGWGRHRVLARIATVFNLPPTAGGVPQRYVAAIC